MKTFQITATTFAAPFVSDEVNQIVEGPDARTVLEAFVARFDHPAGLYAAVCREGDIVRLKWLSNHARALEEARDGSSICTYRSDGPGLFAVDDVHFSIPDPKGGRIVQP